MTSGPQWIAISIFCFFFLLVTIAGFFAARWHGGSKGGLHSLDEWGLAGRKFGTLISWFLIGGDMYTAYTVIAVPALVYGTGALAFFAIPYCVLIYPCMLVVLPKFWNAARAGGHVTLADFIRGRYNHRWLAVAFAMTGLLATMPFIALQLIGMQVVIASMGIEGEWPLVLAFLVLAAYTYSSGLRAPALIAIVKDVMLYIMVLAAVIAIPLKLGGYAHIFAAAGAALKTHTPPGSLILQPGQYWAFSTLALGSMLAVMLYPHNVTGVLASKSGRVIQRNAALLPAYNILLVLFALLGYIALAAGIHSANSSMVVPLLLLKMFPQWFAGFCLAAIGVGALVPAAIMSIAAANLVTRNIWGEFRRSKPAPRLEATVAKAVSLAVKAGALAFVLWIPAQYAIQLQLLGGIWMVQLLPGLLAGLYLPRLQKRSHGWALFAGWLAGMASGTAMAASLGLKSSVYPLHFAGHLLPMYAALPALVLNIAVAAIGSAAFNIRAAESQTLSNEMGQIQ